MLYSLDLHSGVCISCQLQCTWYLSGGWICSLHSWTCDFDSACTQIVMFSAHFYCPCREVSHLTNFALTETTLSWKLYNSDHGSNAKINPCPLFSCVHCYSCKPSVLIEAWDSNHHRKAKMCQSLPYLCVSVKTFARITESSFGQECVKWTLWIDKRAVLEWLHTYELAFTYIARRERWIRCVICYSW